jgi:hypothetical protein
MKFLILLFLCNLAFADNAVYKQILTNRPKIDKIKAKQIAHHISMVYIKYKIPKKVYAAILMEESRYKLGAVNNSSSDYCMAQINIRTIKAFKFDKKRLLTDLEYCIEAGAIVLADFQRMYAHKEATWFTRYNSSNPIKRKSYFNRVYRWMDSELKAKYAKH